MKDLGPIRLKGIAEPISPFILAREKTASSRFEARSAVIRPIVGRETDKGFTGTFVLDEEPG